MATALSPRRQKLMDEAQWWLRNTGTIHYAQTRPMPLTASQAHRLPLTTDCSGAVTCIYHAAGAPDPNELGYSGQGFTGTLFANGEPMPIEELEPGDLIIVGRGDESHHAYMMMRDHVLFSHGREAAPEKRTLSDAIAYHGRDQLFGRQYLLPTASRKEYTWVILNGKGERLREVSHPARFAAAHPKMFRKFGRVSFVRKEK